MTSSLMATGGGIRHIVSVENHSEIVRALQEFCEENDIRCGTISGIGAVNEATLRFFNPATKQYVDRSFAEQMEIANLTGNISTLDGKIYLHLHIILGREDYTTIGGHLMSARLCGAGEFVIEPFEAEAPRKFNPEIGLNIYDFPASR